MAKENPLDKKRKRNQNGKTNGKTEVVETLPALPPDEPEVIEWKDSEDRQRHVAKLRTLGLTHDQMATRLNVSRNTIGDDVAAIREANRLRIRKPDPTHELAISVGRLEAIYELAALECEAAPKNSNARGGFLKLMLDITKKTDDLKLETGLIRRHVESGETEAEALLGFDPTDMTPEAIKSKAGTTIAEMLLAIDKHNAKDIVLMIVQVLRENGVVFAEADFRPRRATARA